MKSEDKKFLLLSFLSWRVALFIFLFLAIKILPQQKLFLGGGLTNYLQNPYFWAWTNFDGEHYLSIAQNGYGFGEQAFFPLFPLLIKFLGKLLGGSLIVFNLSGLLISNASFLIGLLGLIRLVRLDYSERVARAALILFLLFPTSFYFGSVYTESLFFALVIWSFYCAKKQRWLFASCLGALASATRVIGIVILPALFLEWWSKKAKKIDIQVIFLFLIPLGLAGYMYYLYIRHGDPLAFWRALPGFGEQRSTVPILLPQVFYRYIFKILPQINYSYFPIVFSTYLEFLSGVAFLAISSLAFFKMRLSYSTFLILGYLLPTLSGSFSSFSRYVLVLFPAFILAASYLSKATRLTQILIYTLLFICLAVATTLFVRGYWLA